MPRKKYPANVVGSQIRKVRGRLGLTQEQLAAQCQLAGLDISRSTLGQIEARLRYVSDEELIVLASLLGAHHRSALSRRNPQAASRQKAKAKKREIPLTLRL